jgi:hypothetical protein
MSRRAQAALGGVLWLVAFLHSVARGADPHDESWFLRVVDRVAGGDALYGDVFFGSTPLAVWVGLGPVAVLGSEVVVMKAVAAAVAAGAALAAASAGRSLGLGARAAAVLAVLCVVLPGLRASVLYNPLAIALTLGALAALLRWEPPRGSRRPVVVAAGLAGLAFATKHNVGALALLAVAAGVLVIGGLAAARRTAAPAALAAAAGALVPFVPVALSGSLDRFVEYGVTAKGTYTERAGVSLLGEMERGLTAWLDVRDLPTFEDALLQAAFLALPVAAVALAVAARAARRDRRARLAVTGLFGAAIVANLYPRADAPHLRVALPVIFLALAVAWHDLVPEGLARRAGGATATALAVLLVFASIAEPPAKLVTRRAVLSDLPHLRGVLVTPHERDRLHAERRRLVAAGQEHASILALGSSAAYVQLLGGLESPTPYDYPLITALGHDGEAETAAAVRSGAIPAACITGSPPDLAAVRLERAVRESLRERADLGPCRLYAR